jgi:hypothetical protein
MSRRFYAPDLASALSINRRDGEGETQCLQKSSLFTRLL